jgi:hypothetical protein
MLNSGKKIRALRNKKINILTLVLSEKKILNETKNNYPPPPFKLNGRSLIIIHIIYLSKAFIKSSTTFFNNVF